MYRTKSSSLFKNSFIKTFQKSLIASQSIGQGCFFYFKPSILRNIVYYSRDSSKAQFKSLFELTAVELKNYQLTSEKPDQRLQLIFCLASFKYVNRIILKTRVSALSTADCSVPSVVSIFSSANWLERETWEMFGIHFQRHTGLRRILTDYGFEGNPMRKDFPLSGYNEVRYDDSKKRVITKPLELTQEFRLFDYEPYNY
jgi:NADH dehydrogenase (ubiquinone) Fe-S protein 3